MFFKNKNFEFFHRQININNVPKDAFIIDVRQHSEHAEVSLWQNHILIPLNKLSIKKFAEKMGLNKHDNIYVLCKTGKRGTKAALAFEAQGFKNIFIIKGGMDDIIESGYKNINKSYVISMERQVRIGAGGLVLLFSLLAFLLSIYFIFGVIFIGAGLVFAGVTNSCGMAKALALLPWNKSEIE